MQYKNFFFAFVLVLGTIKGAIAVDSNESLDFNRDVRPILSDTCYKCHGPDPHDRYADLRLDTKQGILDASELLSPGDTEHSELLSRVFSDDEDEVMPPPSSGRNLTAEQKEILKRWVAEGANWENHWSFVPPIETAVPKLDDDWASNEIDSFVLKRLNEIELRPNDAADRLTLIRRLCLDLTGLPPTPAQLEKFASSRSARWYEELVESLFQSPHYGEHMARFWLDAARYADTHGLHLDNYREMWLYRDWVVDAFNNNLPYNDFVLEQLAGDLLENPTDSQLIATGFNRAHVTTNEGGSISEEVLVRNVVDRVSTTGTVFMGLTVGCAQCHDHKYDPISQKDFYSLYAFFNSLDANPMDGNRKDHAPILRYFDDDQKAELAQLRELEGSLESEIKKLLASFQYKEPDGMVEKVDSEKKKIDYFWFDDEIPAAKTKTDWISIEAEKFKPFSGTSSFQLETDSFRQAVLQGSEHLLRIGPDDVLFFHVYLDPESPPRQIMVQFNNGSWEHRAFWGEDLIDFGTVDTPGRLRKGELPEVGKWLRLEVTAKEMGFTKKTAINGIAFSQHGGRAYWDLPGVVTDVPQSFDKNSFADWRNFQNESGGVGLPNPIKKALTNSDANDEVSIRKKLMDHYLRNVNPSSTKLIATPTQELAEVKKTISDMTRAAPTTLIWREKNKPVAAYVLDRGEYDQKGDAVSRQTPASLPAFGEDLRRDRLGLARWLLDPQHPLTSRVAVNRIWQQFFGTGIVATAEDFGAQGELPTHPELLDWLALDFIQSGWDMKSLVKKIVMSSSYRQSTKTDPLKVKLDPGNRLMSRGPRFRLDAETLRDQALAVSGLLVKTVGGPTVKPPQPDGLWYAVGYSGSNTVRFKRDKGREKVHRRSLYTFWKRTAPPPQMSTLDAPSRESCLVRRERTNTPLQALLLMNEPQYVEAARNLAQLALDQEHAELRQDVKFMYERAMGCAASEETMKILMDDVQSSLGGFIKAKEQARELVNIGETPADERYDVVQLASLTMLANLIMNQDAFISKN